MYKVKNVLNLNVQSSGLYNNKYMITSTQTTNTEILAFIVVPIFSYSTVKFCFKTEKIIETDKK